MDPERAVQFLPPANPVALGRSTPIPVVIRQQPQGAPENGRLVWRWGDGTEETAPVGDGPATGADLRLRRSHRYAREGVYRVQLRDGTDGAAEHFRYATVYSRALPGVCGSGWLRGSGSLAFGFLIIRHDAGASVRGEFRHEDERGLDVAGDVRWLLVGDAGLIHFGGALRDPVDGADHPYRVDASPTYDRRGFRRTHHLTLSTYAPDAEPGVDGPISRVVGLVRPGRIEIRRLPR